MGDTALAADDPNDGDPLPAAYLLGFVAPATATGYVHVVGVRDDHRRRGLARALYDAFATLAEQRGAQRLKAITTPANAGSLAFHAALGFHAEPVTDYSGPGADRVVLTRPLRG